MNSKIIEVDGNDIRLLVNLYWNQMAAMRIRNQLSERKLIRRGVRQECVLSPDLFSLSSEMILRPREDEEGISVGGRNITIIRFADNMVFVAKSKVNLQKILDKSNVESEVKGLMFNCKKTVAVVFSKKQVKPVC